MKKHFELIKNRPSLLFEPYKKRIKKLQNLRFIKYNENVGFAQKLICMITYYSRLLSLIFQKLGVILQLILRRILLSLNI